MKHRMLLLIIMALMILSQLTDQALARQNGVTDQDLNQSQTDQNGPDCGIGCHNTSSRTGNYVSISLNRSGAFKTRENGIQVNVTTSISGTDGDIMGIMLVNNANPYGMNIKNDGWIITSAPNGANTFNFNQKISLLSLNQTYLWVVTAPATEGTYYFIANARYGTSGSSPEYGETSYPLSITVDGTVPSVRSNTNNVYVKNGDLLTLNATITDALSGVKNATVNVSALNSTIKEAILTLSGGYWVNTTIRANKGDTAGFKNLTITAYDNASNVNKSVNMTAGIDITAPSVTSNTNNVIVSNGSLLTLNASITDAFSGVKNATVNVSALNSTINEAILTLSGGYYVNTTIRADRGETTVLKNLTITTYDNLSNINKTINMTAGIDVTPPFLASNTNNIYVSNGSYLTLNASITDAFSGVKNATVNVSAVNSTINEAILILSGGYWINTTIRADRGETADFKNLTITTYDNVSNVNKSVNMTVRINPKLEIIDWSNNITNNQSLTITIFINDSVRFDITPNQNVSYNWSYDGTDQSRNANNFSKQFQVSGLHYTNATVRNSDSTVFKNWTMNVIYKPDLVMTLGNISFSYIPSEAENGEVKENVNVTINATVYNSGLGNASTFNVSFYDGSPGPGNNIANATITNISAGKSQNATIYWNSIIGTHTISIKVDPENTLIETDDSNNNASKIINVSAWQKYYGNLSGNLSLKDTVGNSLTDWSWTTLQGNIFVSNIPSLNFTNLQALGRKKNGAVSQNNFLKADELLTMTPGSSNATGFFNNNITQLFSTNGTSPRNYTNFTAYGRKIDTVAIVNSTNTTNFTSIENSPFITGILWDTTKDNGDGEYGDDGEELVFIAGINGNKAGLGNSFHDYETTIPSIIRSENNVYFFVELK